MSLRLVARCLPLVLMLGGAAGCSDILGDVDFSRHQATSASGTSSAGGGGGEGGASTATGSGGAASSTTGTGGATASSGATGGGGAGGAEPPSCTDGVMNQDETDKDCGGTLCGPCADQLACHGDADCQSRVCFQQVCQPATCSDNVQNKGETGLDCGGPDCAPCGPGSHCEFNRDCDSNICLDGGTCAEADCGDQVQNHGETYIDCGGPCGGCDTGQPCNVDNDCASSICGSDKKCVAPTCFDHVYNQDESDVDCGGSVCAARCAFGKICHQDSDCGDGVCDDVGFYCRPQIVLLASGGYHTCVITQDGLLRCWGQNQHGQLGLGDDLNRGDDAGEVGVGYTPVDLGTGRKAVQVRSSDASTCALLDDGTIKCWGFNDHGVLGSGGTDDIGYDLFQMGDDLHPVDLGAGQRASAVEVNGDHACALLLNGSVKCWGHNQYGQLATGDKVDRGTSPSTMGDNLPTVSLGGHTVKEMALGQSDTCFHLDDDSVVCWGVRYNAADQVALKFGAGRTVKSLRSGYNHQCAILDDDQVRCWGFNDDGRLGLGNTDDNYNGYYGTGGDLSAFPKVALGTGRSALELTLQDNSACVLLDNQQVKCWGSNTHGQLGTGDTVLYGATAAQMGDGLPHVDFGTDFMNDPLRASHVYGQAQSACAVLVNGQLKCWGYNDYGQLGQGDRKDRGGSAASLGNNLPIVVF